MVLEGIDLKAVRALPCVALAICSVLGFSGFATSLSELAPNFSITDIDGNEFVLSDHRGKVVLIDFTQTTCSPCEDMMVSLVSIRENYSEQELVMISISGSDHDTEEDLRDFKSENNGTWFFAKDIQGIHDTYDLYATPTEYFVDVNGCVSSKMVGYKTWDVIAERIEDAKTGCEPESLSPVTIEEPAFDFTIIDVDGNHFTLSETESKPVLIEFFDPSGLSSVLMHKQLLAIRENFTTDELIIISIGVGTSDDQDIMDFRDEHGGDWMYARDTQGLWQQYGVTQTPTTCIVDVIGNVQFHSVGFLESGVILDDIEDAQIGDQPPPICPECWIWPVVLVGVIIAGVISALAYWSIIRGRKSQ